MNKMKKGEMSVNKLILIVLAVAVLLAVLMFAFKSDLNRWINNLPGYLPPEDRVVDLTKQVDSAVQSQYCPVEVGKITADYFYIYYPGEEGRKSGMQKTMIYIKGSEEEGKLYLDINWAIDPKIGDIINKIIYINPQITGQQGSLYDDVKNYLPSIELVKNLDNAYYFGSNQLCRLSEVSLP